MIARARATFEHLMSRLVYVGFGVLIGWVAAGMFGLATGSWGVETQATLKFLLAVLIVTFAHRTYLETREWLWRKHTSVDDQSGFTAA
jgi:hypothetical protein